MELQARFPRIMVKQGPMERVMRIPAIIVFGLALLVGGSLAAQADDAKKTEKPKAEKPEAKKEAKPVKPRNQLSDAGKTLFEDCERIYKKYYAVVLKKTKTNEDYKAVEVWNDAVKEAKNAKYKDSKEWSTEVLKMQRKDRAFKKKIRDLMNRLSRENRKAIEEWAKK